MYRLAPQSVPSTFFDLKEVFAMDIKRINPWNWLRHEDNASRDLPAERDASPAYSPLFQLHRDLDSLFDGVFHNIALPAVAANSLASTDPQLFRPHIDLAASDNDYSITVEVPGVEEKDIKLELNPDGVLTIRGEKKRETEHQDKSFHRAERTYGVFHRALSLPDDAHRDAVDATFKNGVLTITVPRHVAAQAPAKQIEIKTAA